MKLIKASFNLSLSIISLFVTVGSYGQLNTTNYGSFSGNKGENNSNFGSYAGFQTIGSNNTNIGLNAGIETTTGSGNTNVGAWAGDEFSTSSNNTMIGAYSGLSYGSGNGNTFLGANAGSSPLNYNPGYNVFIGYDAGLGFDFTRSGFSAAGGVFILNNQASVNKPLLFGTFAQINEANRDLPSNNQFYSDPRLGIGTSVLDQRSVLTVGGNVTVSGRIHSNTQYGGLYLDSLETSFVGTGGDFFGFWSSNPSIGWNALKIRKSDGNVGIGMADPTSKLSVAGAVTVSSTAANGGNLKLSHDGYLASIESNADTKGLRIESKIGKRIFLSADTITIGTTAGRPGYNVTINGPTFIKYAPNASNQLLDRYQLWVDKGVVAEDFAVGSVADWPDFVFDKTYELPSLQEVSEYIQKNHHLDGLPSAETVKEQGISIIEINKKLLQKIEELTLYTIDQEKVNLELERQLKDLEQVVEQLQKKLGKKSKSKNH